MPRPPVHPVAPAGPHGDAPAAPAAPVAPPIDAAEAAAASAFGRVDDDGTVWVREAAGERTVGQFPGASVEDALSLYVRRFLDLKAKVVLFETRLTATDLAVKEIDQTLTKLAEELENLNRERQAVEERILRAAVEQIESWPEARRSRRGYVVAGEGWHEGVIGIVASRLVERYNRPVVLIAGAEGQWKGSGRSVSAFDLHGALGACSAHLERYGGHRAAAGLTIAADRVEAFAAAFAAHADAVLSEDDLRPVTRVDAIVPGRKLNLDLCAELNRLAPFGLGNPGVLLLVDGCDLADLSTVGDGKHRVGGH